MNLINTLFLFKMNPLLLPTNFTDPFKNLSTKILIQQFGALTNLAIKDIERLIF